MFANSSLTNAIKVPTTYELISAAWKNGDAYTPTKDCWVVASVRTTGTTYAVLSVHAADNPPYLERSFAYGVASRTLLVKLYVKAGMPVIIGGEGCIGDISLNTCE